MEYIFSFFDVHKAIEIIKTVPWHYVLLIAFLLTFIENIFPPSPSDVLLMFMGSLISIGTVGFFPLFITSTLGSILGFLLMYWLGFKYGNKIIKSNKLPFITKENLAKPEVWFKKYGYYIIVANRFLSGTRALISFFAGISELPIYKTTILSALSAALWNIILLLIGFEIGENIEQMNYILNIYGKILIPLIVVLILGFLLYNKFKTKKLN